MWRPLTDKTENISIENLTGSRCPVHNIIHQPIFSTGTNWKWLSLSWNLLRRFSDLIVKCSALKIDWTSIQRKHAQVKWTNQKSCRIYYKFNPENMQQVEYSILLAFFFFVQWPDFQNRYCKDHNRLDTSPSIPYVF